MDRKEIEVIYAMIVNLKGNGNRDMYQNGEQGNTGKDSPCLCLFVDIDIFTKISSAADSMWKWVKKP